MPSMDGGYIENAGAIILAPFMDGGYVIDFLEDWHSYRIFVDRCLN